MVPCLDLLALISSKCSNYAGMLLEKSQVDKHSSKEHKETHDAGKIRKVPNWHDLSIQQAGGMADCYSSSVGRASEQNSSLRGGF